MSSFFLLLFCLWCLPTHRHCGLLLGSSGKRNYPCPKEPSKRKEEIKNIHPCSQSGINKRLRQRNETLGFQNNLRNSSEEFHRFSRMDCPELVSISTVPTNKFLCVKIVYPQGDSLDKDSDIPAASAFSVNGRTKGPCLEHHGILVQAAAKETT